MNVFESQQYIFDSKFCKARNDEMLLQFKIQYDVAEFSEASFQCHVTMILQK